MSSRRGGRSAFSVMQPEATQIVGTWGYLGPEYVETGAQGLQCRVLEFGRISGRVHN